MDGTMAWNVQDPAALKSVLRKERAKKYKAAWREKNKEHLRKYIRDYRKANPAYVEAELAKHRLPSYEPRMQRKKN